MRLRFGQDGFHVLRVGRHGDPAVILRRRADHGRPANVDVLDAGVEIGAARHRCLERVEVHVEHVEALDAVRLHRRRVLGVVAQRQQAAMHFGVQRLHPAIHHLRKAGDSGDVRHIEPGVGDCLLGAAGGDQRRA